MARIVQSLNQNWLFQLGNVELNTQSVDTSEFECVHLPHSEA